MRMPTVSRSSVAAALAALTISLAPFGAQATLAAPADQACAYGVVTQPDMAGTYVSSFHQMRVEMYPCGGTYVQWSNVYGTHYASYGAVKRVPAEGIIARPLPESQERLDWADVIGFKAAEPGFIQVITVDAYGNDRTYRLQKVS